MTGGGRREAVLAAIPLVLVLVSSRGAMAAGPSKPAAPTTSAPKSQGSPRSSGSRRPPALRTS